MSVYSASLPGRERLPPGADVEFTIQQYTLNHWPEEARHLLEARERSATNYLQMTAEKWPNYTPSELIAQAAVIESDQQILDWLGRRRDS